MGSLAVTLISPTRGLSLVRIEYDDGDLGRVHDRLGQMAEYGTQLSEVLANIHAGLEGRGESIRAVKGDAGELETGIRRAIAAAEAVADVVRAYHDTATTHARAANALVDDIQTADLRTTATRADRDRIDEILSQVQPEERSLAAVYEDLRDEYDRELAESSDALAALWEQWEAAYSRWDAGYDEAVAALAHVDGSAVTPAARRAIDALAQADTPEQVAAAWASLTEAERAALVAERPSFVGNLDGIPYDVRFAANRDVYTQTVAAGPYGEPLDAQLEQLGREIDRHGGELLFFRPFEQPQATAAVAYGVARDAYGVASDPFDGVTNVNTLVGGMFSGLDDLSAWGESARDLNDYANAYGDPGTSSMTIAWYGYDSPSIGTEPFMGSAREGAARLTETLRGLRAETTGNVTTTVIGHSYGSTTAFLAVGSAGSSLGVDRLIAVGSAGITTEVDGQQLDFSGTDVFTSRATWDVVARVGQWTSIGHASDPADIPGAVTFESDGGRAPSLGGGTEEVAGTPGHAAHDGGNSFFGWWEKGNGYLSVGSESFRNIASIVATGEALR